MSILKTFPFQLSLALKDEHFFRKSLTFLFKYLAYLIVGLIVVKVSYDLIWADTNYFNHLDQKGVNSFQMLRSVIASLFSLVLITILAKYLFDRLTITDRQLSAKSGRSDSLWKPYLIKYLLPAGLY